MLVLLQQHVPGLQAHRFRDGPHQLALPVALHPGQAVDLPGAHLKAQVLQHQVAARRALAQAPHFQDHLTGGGRRLVHVQEHGLAHHQLGDQRLGSLRAQQGLHHLAPADHGDAVGDVQHLVQLVADEDQALALVAHHAEGLEQLHDLLRGEHRGGLVEHQDLRAAVQDLQDLHALLQAHGQVLHPRGQVHRQAVAVHDLGDLPRRLLQAQHPGGLALLAQDDVLQHAEGRHQHEVLVHHADAPGDGVPRVLDGHRLVAQADGAGVRPVQAVEDLHQGGLARAVLAHQGVDFAGGEVEGDLVVGPHSREHLGDPVHFQQRHGVLSKKAGRRIVPLFDSISRRLVRRPSWPTRPPWRRRPAPVILPAMIFFFRSSSLAGDRLQLASCCSR